MSDAFGKLFGEEKEFTQPTAFGTLPGFAQRGLKSATGAAQGFLQDPSVFQAVGPTAEQQQAIGVLGQGAQPLTQQRFGEQLDIFFNPFVDRALQPALEDLRREGAGFASDIAGGASSAGAFGGTRQALLESELVRNQMREAGRLSALARSGAFEDASNRALGQLGQQQASAATLFDAGEALRQLQQQTRGAPATAAQFLSGIAGQTPFGGGQTEFREDIGSLGRIGRTAQSFGLGTGAPPT